MKRCLSSPWVLPLLRVFPANMMKSKLIRLDYICNVCEIYVTPGQGRVKAWCIMYQGSGHLALSARLHTLETSLLHVCGFSLWADYIHSNQSAHTKPVMAAIQSESFLQPDSLHTLHPLLPLHPSTHQPPLLPGCFVFRPSSSVARLFEPWSAFCLLAAAASIHESN